MRYIDITDLIKNYPPKKYWCGEYWKDKKVKDAFRDHFHKKCWYTEASLVGSDMHVDHFRPKARISKYAKTNYNKPIASIGYFWLRNDTNNYRGACAYVNRGKGSGGKHDYFPLKDGSPYATLFTDCSMEIPMLFDPCNKDDVKYITFVKGKAECASTDPYILKRFEVSEKILNLNHKDFEEARQMVWRKVLDELNIYKKSEKLPNDLAHLVYELKKLTDRKQTFSACAIACINSCAPSEVKKQLDLEL